MKKSELESLIENIVKRVLDEAGGEGSRGGKVIGHTKSGKPIYRSQNARIEKSYNAEDHKDAATAHLTHLKNRGNDRFTKEHENEFKRHSETSKHKKLNQNLDK